MYTKEGITNSYLNQEGYSGLLLLKIVVLQVRGESVQRSQILHTM